MCVLVLNILEDNTDKDTLRDILKGHANSKDSAEANKTRVW